MANMTPERCDGFRVLPEKSFFPIDVHSWRQFFNESKRNSDWDESVVGVHVWNQMSSGGDLSNALDITQELVLAEARFQLEYFADEVGRYDRRPSNPV